MELNDMMDADSIDKKTWKELRGLASENIVELKNKHLEDVDVVITQNHKVGVSIEGNPRDELSISQQETIAEISHLVMFFHIRHQDVARTFESPETLRDRKKLKPRGQSGSLLISDDGLDALKSSLDRIWDCPECGKQTGISKDKLREEDDPEFKCDQCGNTWLLSEIKEDDNQ